MVGFSAMIARTEAMLIEPWSRWVLSSCETTRKSIYVQSIHYKHDYDGYITNNMYPFFFVRN